jgi:hypothetical protein
MGEKTMRVGKRRANRLLSTADFLTDGAGVLQEPERNGVAPGVIADPVTLLVRTSSQRPSGVLNSFPTTKKVVRMDRRASTSRTRGVVSGSGPLSNVSVRSNIGARLPRGLTFFLLQ